VFRRDRYDGDIKLGYPWQTDSYDNYNTSKVNTGNYSDLGREENKKRMLNDKNI
jgi:hypothetical protein